MAQAQLALGIGFLAGAFNGTVVANTDVNPLVITLAMLFLYSGIAAGLPKSFTWFGTGRLGWVPIPLVITMVLTLIAGWLMLRTRFGRFLQLIGVNPEAARIGLSAFNRNRANRSSYEAGRSAVAVNSE